MTTYIRCPSGTDAVIRLLSEAFSEGDEFVTCSLELCNSIR